MSYIPNLKFVVDEETDVNKKTKLSKSVTMGTFTKGYSFTNRTLSDKKQLHRNLMPHAAIYEDILNNTNKFSDFKLEVVEGVYTKDPEETLTPNGILDLQTKGRAIVYELRNLEGNVQLDKTLEAAEYIAIFHKNYDKIILDYDTYDPDGSLNAQIIITTPNIPQEYTSVEFKRQFETQFNNAVIGQDFIEVTEGTAPRQTFPAEVSTQSGYYTVGDIHSKLIAVHGGSPWETFAESGRTSRNTIVIDNINKLKTGTIVAISVGQNDILQNTDTPAVIAENVKTIVKTSIDLGHDVTYLTPPVTSAANAQRAADVRNAIIAALGEFNTLSIIDLNDPTFTFGPDGKTFTIATYQTIAGLLL